MNPEKLYYALPPTAKAAAARELRAPLSRLACATFLPGRTVAHPGLVHFFDYAKQYLDTGWPLEGQFLLDAAGARGITMAYRGASQGLGRELPTWSQVLTLGNALKYLAQSQPFVAIHEIDVIEALVADATGTESTGDAQREALKLAAPVVLNEARETARLLKGDRGLAIAEMLLLEDPSGMLLAKAIDSVLSDEKSKALDGWSPR